MMIHPRTGEYIRKTHHDCNAYCMGTRHADIARTSMEYSVDELKKAMELVFPEEKVKVLSIIEAPESSPFTNDGIGPYKYRWLIIWEYSE